MRPPLPSTPQRPEFLRLARTHTLVPVYRRLTADLETPVSAFLRLAANEPECFLLESVEGGEKVGRYTFIGVRPYQKIVARGASIEITEPAADRRIPSDGKRRNHLQSTTEGKRQTFEGDVFALLKQSLSGHKPARLAGLPPFTAGAVGFFSYDAVRLIERLPSLALDDLQMPDACLMFFDEVLAFDHVKKEMLLIVTADLTRRKPAPAYADALERLDRIESALAAPLAPQRNKAVPGKLKVTMNTRKKDFLAGVDTIKEYIAAGDIFQAVYSQRFEVEPAVDPFSIYRALRIVNPSPYMYFLRFNLGGGGPRKTSAKRATHIVGSSPELLVRVHDRAIEYRPIAGTRQRSADEEEDRRIAAELFADEKERAEHVMLVDLGRNDVGRVSEFGSVRVKDLMFVERYSHVMHLVSSIEGRLREGLTPVDAFRACFPAGTLSGAPKVRAMQIIEELEPTRRGIYGGSVLYADFSGNLDSCIAIRTLLLQGKQGYIQAGAGIVADSVPEKEYEESLNKSRAVVQAIKRARGA
ncbi:MAG TPA: anthranilate synthase component I [Acidisarcina sp.]